LYRHVSEIRHRIHPRLAQPARSGVQAGLIGEPAAFVDNLESQRQFLKFADHARCVPLRATGGTGSDAFKNFVGIPDDQLLERLLELTLYTEENLR